MYDIFINTETHNISKLMFRNEHQKASLKKLSEVMTSQLCNMQQQLKLQLSLHLEHRVSTLSLYNRHKSLSPIAPLAIYKKARPVSKEFDSCETWKQRLEKENNYNKKKTFNHHIPKVKVLKKLQNLSCLFQAYTER